MVLINLLSNVKDRIMNKDEMIRLAVSVIAAKVRKNGFLYSTVKEEMKDVVKAIYETEKYISEIMKEDMKKETNDNNL